MAFEGEFAMCAGHAQELKTQAIALQVGKRLRIFFSDNNAGIDDSLIGGVVHSKFEAYRLRDQWTSYGWNVFDVADGHDYGQILDALKTMEAWDADDRRPMIVIGKTTKGHWPAPVKDQIVGYPSHPFGFKMNSDYIVGLAGTYEERYGVKFDGMRAGAVADPRERLLQFKTNIDVALSVLDKNGLGDWLAERLVDMGDEVSDKTPLRIDVTATRSSTTSSRRQPSGRAAEGHGDERRLRQEKTVSIALFRNRARRPARGVSEIIKWLNYVTGNRMLSVAADLSESVNLGHGALWGHYDPDTNPLGTRLKAAIRKPATCRPPSASSARTPPSIGEFAGVWAISGTYGHSRRSCICRRGSGASRTRTANSRRSAAYPVGAFRPRNAADARTSASSRRRCGSSSLAATSSS
jgi:hypothetical protein